MIGFITPYIFTHLRTTGNTALSFFYTLYSSPLHMHYNFQSSLVVSWQRIPQQYHCNFNSYMKSSWRSLIPFLLFPAAANSEGPTQFARLLFYTVFWLCPIITTRRGPHGKHRLLLSRMCLQFRCPAIDILLLSTFVADYVYRTFALQLVCTYEIVHTETLLYTF
jgi:hypothetical protein